MSRGLWRTIRIGNTTFENQRFIVVKDMICSVILGIDLWSRVSHLSFDFKNNSVSLGDTGDCIPLWSHPFTNEVGVVRDDNEEKQRQVLVAEDTILPARSEKYVKCVSRGTDNGRDYLIQPISQEDSLISTPFGVLRAQLECTSSSVLGGKRSQLCLCCRPTHSPSGSPIRTTSSIRCGAGTVGY